MGGLGRGVSEVPTRGGRRFVGSNNFRLTFPIDSLHALCHALTVDRQSSPTADTQGDGTMTTTTSTTSTTSPSLSRTAAKRQAHRESCMYRQGSGWIVSIWDPTVRCNRVTGEMAYFSARHDLAAWRRRRAQQLQHGHPLV